MKKFLFYFILFAYGIIQTLIGAILYVLNVKKKHSIFHGAIVTEWDFDGNVSLGPFIFVNKYQKNYQLVSHEYGHTIQSLLFGPLWILIIGLPSIFWCGCFNNYRIKNNVDYYSFYTESWANKLGENINNAYCLLTINKRFACNHFADYNIIKGGLDL